LITFVRAGCPRACCAPEPATAAARDDGDHVNHTFFSIMRVYTSFIVKNYSARTIGRDCNPNPRKIGSTLVSARFQNAKTAEAFFLPLGVSAILRTL